MSSLPPLGDLEHEILTILWEGGEMTAVDVRRKVARDLKDATIRTVLRRLEEKGYVKHAVEGRTFIYSAAEPAQNVAVRAVKHIIDRFCGGSVEQLMIGMVDNEVIDRKELDRLARKIAARKEGKR